MSGQIPPEDEPQEGIYGYGGWSFKSRVKNAIKMSTSGLGSEPDDGEELSDDDVPD